MRPREIGIKLEKERRERAQIRLKRTRAEFKEEGARLGVKTFDESR
jgi:hypothetical protein